MNFSFWHPQDSPEGICSLTIPGQQPDRQGVRLLTCRCLPRSKRPELRNERLIGLNVSLHIPHIPRAKSSDPVPVGRSQPASLIITPGMSG